MDISKLRGDHDEQNGGYAEGWKRPSTTEPYLEFFFLHNTTKKLLFTLSKVVPAVE